MASKDIHAYFDIYKIVQLNCIRILLIFHSIIWEVSTNMLGSNTTTMQTVVACNEKPQICNTNGYIQHTESHFKITWEKSLSTAIIMVLDPGLAT